MLEPSQSEYCIAGREGRELAGSAGRFSRMLPGHPKAEDGPSGHQRSPVTNCMTIERFSELRNILLTTCLDSKAEGLVKAQADVL